MVQINAQRNTQIIIIQNPNKEEKIMPIVGNTSEAKIVGASYSRDPLYSYAKAFKECAESILNESGLDIFDEPKRVMRGASTREAMKRFFVENCYDENDTTLTLEEKEDIVACQEQQFENDVKAMNEHASLPDYNPIVGMALPIHKLILMNMVFDKGAIQKVTATSPKFTISLERRILVTPSGDELDMFLDQNQMTDAINSTAPFKEFDLSIPEDGSTDILGALGGAQGLDNLAISTYISAINIGPVLYEPGDILPNDDGFVTEDGEVAEEEQEVDTWIRTNIKFNPNYGGPGHYERVLVQAVTWEAKVKDATTGEVTSEQFTDTLSATMNKNVITVTNLTGAVANIKLKTRLDTSNGMLETCSVKWKVDTELVEIDTSIPINTTISPEEVKDLAALYQVNQLTKLMGMFKTALANYKDDTILAGLNEDYETMNSRRKTFGQFDFKPRVGYALDHVEWRHKTFFDYLDSQVTKLLQVWNDPNVTIAVFGDPELIRKITPKEYTYQAPAAIGPVELTYTQTVVNASDKRVYSLLGSDKLRGSDTLIVVLNPRNTDRIMYRIYDYQMYVSNEIRNAKNWALPAITAFERFKFLPYQSVQGRIEILNRTGL